MPSTDSLRARLRIALTFATLFALASILHLSADSSPLDPQRPPGSNASAEQSPDVEVQKAGEQAKSRRSLQMLSERGEVQTATTAFEDIPGLQTTVTLGRSSDGCLSATFSGEMTRAGDTGEVLVFRALVDGELMEGHNQFGYLVHYPAASLYEMASYTFWMCGLAPGTHTVAIQWRSGQGNIVAIRARTLVVDVR